MDRIKQGMRAAGLIAVVGMATIAPAAASAAAISNETLTLNTRSASTAAGTVSTAGTTVNRQWYVTSVTGTFSFNAASYWTAIPTTSVFRICGTLQGAPWSASPGLPAGTNGKVSADAEYLFARRWQWDCNTAKVPLKMPNFEANYTGSSGWAHEVPAGGVPNAPTTDHRYVYFKKAATTGQKVAFRLTDSVSSDNYGRLSVTIRRATSSDCGSNGWQLFLKTDGTREFSSDYNCRFNI